ncbi:hypothetical protein [Paenibacillus herberti]|uniref:Uncharacterized protein n=1 Tax=Paenibacillus herberti TaxID=1619309 RepID=A0A229P034_9BACL|nr:hypothetical protein [Paenibacillus herberti]OXM15550.1 hypothetical protein CGZ75_02085 [Paenibacillus herberti]
MADAFKGIIVTVLLVFAFAVYPAYRQAEQAESNIRQQATAAAVEFVDRIRSKGYVDPSDYHLLTSALDSTGLLYQVQMEYYKKVLEPIYTDPNNFSTFQGSFSVRYDGYFTAEILNALYPAGNPPVPEDAASRRFRMRAGDMFTLRLTSKETTMAGRMKSLIFREQSAPIAIKYGGMVRSEAP